MFDLNGDGDKIPANHFFHLKDLSPSCKPGLPQPVTNYRWNMKFRKEESELFPSLQQKSIEKKLTPLPDGTRSFPGKFKKKREND